MADLDTEKLKLQLENQGLYVTFPSRKKIDGNFLPCYDLDAKINEKIIHIEVKTIGSKINQIKEGSTVSKIDDDVSSILTAIKDSICKGQHPSEGINIFWIYCSPLTDLDEFKDVLYSSTLYSKELKPGLTINSTYDGLFFKPEWECKRHNKRVHSIRHISGVIIDKSEVRIFLPLFSKFCEEELSKLGVTHIYSLQSLRITTTSDNS